MSFGGPSIVDLAQPEGVAAQQDEPHGQGDAADCTEGRHGRNGAAVSRQLTVIRTLFQPGFPVTLNQA